jgi:hypothetical protein
VEQKPENQGAWDRYRLALEAVARVEEARQQAARARQSAQAPLARETGVDLVDWLFTHMNDLAPDVEAALIKYRSEAAK